MPQSINADIRAFIIENFLFGDAADAPEDDASLIENDIVDSTGILEMVSFLEEHFTIDVADPEIVPENFDTIARLSAFVAGKKKARETAPAGA
ncbi:acyl carrier protein [Nitratireductor rhodophyticola]|uniref:acyl carrier protein n=1 Tax=Nitratireductor rhodophyticola TaxID=2854036 RepID=UPI002AC9A105|nr:acyl carrier protein [Nitratireductor rhodophyticola]MEC9247372.1 acyl carrier protein [Pseudomonadota bacterium]WPZ12500.1 acyl carrier protein [Nitratireductor rhodophyticola]